MPSQRSRRSRTFDCSRLPTEVLLEIFSNTVDPDEFASTVWSDEDLAVPRVLLQVCSSWRRTALSCHSLWLAIPLHDSRWTELALHLSQPKPINVEMPAVFTLQSSPKYLSTPATLLVCESLSRAKNLRLIGETLDLSAVITPKRIATLSLQNLEAKNFWSIPEGAKFFEATFESLPQPMQTFQLAQCDNMKIQVLSNAITSLTLDNCSMYNSPAEILDALAASPSLQQLQMNLVVIFSLEPPPVERRSVSLPNLSSLTLAGCSAHLYVLLPYLAIPSEAKLKISILERNPSQAFAPSADASLEPVLHALSEHFSHTPEGYALSRSTQFNCFYDLEENMSFILSARLPDDTQTMGASPLREGDIWLGDASSADQQFSLNFSYPDSQLNNWADKMIANTQYLHGAHMLYLTSTQSFSDTDQLDDMDSDWWARNLQPFSQVETICVVFPTLLNSLSHAFVEWDEQEHGQILPNLRTIRVSFGSFGAPSAPDAETSSWTLFLKGIQKRMAGGSLQRIELNCCVGVGKKRLARLQELIEVSERRPPSPKFVGELLTRRL